MNVTFNEAVINAARLLMNAELEPDLARMERVESLADSWIGIAVVLAGRDDS
ncbi:hypothetical protein [Nonomuraea basaltis]|uniref:hypothetical protein n=1 Tax=Nonomuraea basaltis TaxID=2495887 RepID=UPI001485D460|nr:hypothetical protein [Nonomuraea basaltis]